MPSAARVAPTGDQGSVPAPINTSSAAGRRSGSRDASEVLSASAARTPIGFVITPGEAHDVTAYGALMDEAAPEPKVLLADRGYDADAIRPTSRNGAARP